MGGRRSPSSRECHELKGDRGCETNKTEDVSVPAWPTRHPGQSSELAAAGSARRLCPHHLLPRLCLGGRVFGERGSSREPSLSKDSAAFNVMFSLLCPVGATHSLTLPPHPPRNTLTLDLLMTKHSPSPFTQGSVHLVPSLPGIRRGRGQ